MSPIGTPSTPVLWAATFIHPGDTALDRYYSTYAIDPRGQLSGLWTDDARYRLLDEFATIARELSVYGLFGEYEQLWRDALQAALGTLNTGRGAR